HSPALAGAPRAVRRAPRAVGEAQRGGGDVDVRAPRGIARSARGVGVPGESRARHAAAARPRARARGRADLAACPPAPDDYCFAAQISSTFEVKIVAPPFCVSTVALGAGAANALTSAVHTSSCGVTAPFTW